MSTEQGPEFRIVGGASPENKEEVKKGLQKALFNHFESLSPEEREKVEKFEYNKSEKETGFIDFANQETNKLRQEFGLESYNIPYENYHLLPSKTYQELTEGGVATTFYTRQGILFDAEKLHSSSPVELGSDLLHETLHLKGYLSIEVEERNEKTEENVFRWGLAMSGAQRGKPHEHFLGLHEAIVAAQEKKSFLRLLDLPSLQKEKEWLMSDEAKEIRKDAAEKRKIPEDEFMWIGRWVDNKGERILFPYFGQRRVLGYVCAEIQKECPQQYQNKDDVFKEFLRAHFTGQLLPIARLVEKTFGKGSFRTLGDMGTEKESAILHMELLEKVRAAQSKKEKFQ